MLAHILSKRTSILPRILSRRMSGFGDHCPLVVTPSQLHELLPSGGVSVLDASWHMPNVSRNARQEFVQKRIPGARYLDLDEVASPNELGLKHMMPSGEVFAGFCGMCISRNIPSMVWSRRNAYSQQKMVLTPPRML